MLMLQARDPIPQFKKFALDAGLLSESDVKDIEKEVLAEVEDAVKFADESPKPVSTPRFRLLHLFEQILLSSWVAEMSQAGDARVSMATATVDLLPSVSYSVAHGHIIAALICPMSCLFASIHADCAEGKVFSSLSLSCLGVKMKCSLALSCLSASLWANSAIVAKCSNRELL